MIYGLKTGRRFLEKYESFNASSERARVKGVLVSLFSKSKSMEQVGTYMYKWRTELTTEIAKGWWDNSTVPPPELVALWSQLLPLKNASHSFR